MTGARGSVFRQPDDPTGSGLLVVPTRPPEQEPLDYVNHIDRTPDNLTRPAIFYILAVSLLGLGAAAYFAPGVSALSRGDLVGLVVLGILATLFERFGMHIYGNTTISVSMVAIFAIALLYGPAGAAVVSPLAALAAEMFGPSQWYRRAFDMGTYTLAGVTIALLFQGLVGEDPPVDGWLIPAAIVAAAASYAVNIPLVAIAVSLTTGQGWWSVWKEKSQWLFPHYLVFGLLGLALAAAYRVLGVAGVLAFVAPPLMMRLAIRQYIGKTAHHVEELKRANLELETVNREVLQMSEELRETYDGTLVALVSALDARDKETKGHSVRVTRYMMDMARQLGVEEGSQEWLDMQRGALLHDVGKIGVRDFVLHKPGRLTDEEWGEMKRHPVIGFEMLKDIPFLSGAAAVVKSHHEHFNGQGYPEGLSVNQIPLGARIFAVADAFDAMISDRPYRKAMPWKAARKEIIRHSGAEFDPVVVEAFLVTYDDWMREQQQEEESLPQAA
jgi:putative nucleotidyltransferase with HDIG domain